MLLSLGMGRLQLVYQVKVVVDLLHQINLLCKIEI